MKRSKTLQTIFILFLTFGMTQSIYELLVKKSVEFIPKGGQMVQQGIRQAVRNSEVVGNNREVFRPVEQPKRYFDELIQVMKSNNQKTAEPPVQYRHTYKVKDYEQVGYNSGRHQDLTQLAQAERNKKFQKILKEQQDTGKTMYEIMEERRAELVSGFHAKPNLPTYAKNLEQTSIKAKDPFKTQIKNTKKEAEMQVIKDFMKNQDKITSFKNFSQSQRKTILQHLMKTHFDHMNYHYKNHQIVQLINFQSDNFVKVQKFQKVFNSIMRKKEVRKTKEKLQAVKDSKDKRPFDEKLQSLEAKLQKMALKKFNLNLMQPIQAIQAQVKQIQKTLNAGEIREFEEEQKDLVELNKETLDVVVAKVQEKDLSVFTQNKKEIVGFSKGSNDLMNVNKQQTDLTIVPTKETNLAQVQNQNKDLRVIEEQNTDVSLFKDQNKDLSIVQEQNKDIEVAKDQQKNLTVIPEQQKDISVILEQQNDLTVIPKQQKDLTVIPEQQNDITVIPKQQKDLTVVEEQQKDLVLKSQQNNDITTIQDQNKDLMIAPKQEKGITIVSDQNKDLQVIPQNKKDLVLQEQQQKDLVRISQQNKDLIAFDQQPNEIQSFKQEPNKIIVQQNQPKEVMIIPQSDKDLVGTQNSTQGLQKIDSKNVSFFRHDYSKYSSPFLFLYNPNFISMMSKKDKEQSSSLLKGFTGFYPYYNQPFQFVKPKNKVVEKQEQEYVITFDPQNIPQISPLEEKELLHNIKTENIRYKYMFENPTTKQQQILFKWFMENKQEMKNLLQRINPPLFNKFEAIKNSTSKRAENLINKFSTYASGNMGMILKELLKSEKVKFDIDSASMKILKEESERIYVNKVIKNARKIYGDKIQYQPGYILDLIKKNPLYFYYQKYISPEFQKEVEKTSKVLKASKIREEISAMKIDDDKQQVTQKQFIKEEKRQPRNIKEVEEIEVRFPFEKIDFLNDNHKKQFYNDQILFQEEEYSKLYLLYLPFRNIALNIEEVCIDNHQWQDCETIVMDMEVLYMQLTRDKRRDFTFIKEKIEEILVKRHLDGLKETLTDLLDEWVELFRENYARLEYLIYQYRVNTF